MRIGINATSLNDRPSGARQRLVGLYGALFRANPDNDYIIYEPSDCRVADWFAGLPNVRGVATPLPSTSRWRRFARGIGLWRGLLGRDRLDCFEALHLPLIRAPACPTILTVHDARPVLGDVPLLRRTLYRHVLRRSLARADAVITVSDTMRADLLAIEPKARITTIYNGIDPAPFGIALPPEPGIASPFILAVGHFEPRKNYDNLVRAFALIAARPDSPRLVIIGKDGGSLAATRQRVDELGLAGQIDLLHSVDDARLVSLYRAARLLVFPSTYEGFGIPLLEAMAADLPLALSNIAVFRELTEDRAAYFDAHDPAAMTSVMLDVLGSPECQAEQRAYGRRRLADFTFATLAAQLNALHRRTVADAAGASGGGLH